MALSTKLTVMISSRCNDYFPSDQSISKLSDIRRELKAEIEALSVFGRPIFEVWINEDTPPQGGAWDSAEVCLAAVKNCDILLVLSNGNAGWTATAGGIGICHAELMTGLASAPSKVRLVALPDIPITKDPDGARNDRFQQYVKGKNLFRGGEAKTIPALKSRVKEALADSLIALAQSGVRDGSKGRYFSGEALDWTRLDYSARQDEMCRILRQSLLARSGSSDANDHIWISVDRQEVLCRVHAIPAALTVSAARERVGQPFLRDHVLAPALTGKRGGPVHLIACLKGATEAQAMKLLGFPDATLVTAPFGIFAADPIQCVQFVFIANCRDETTTRHGLQRFFEWLQETGEDVLVARRAAGRAQIVRVIAAQATR